MLQLRCRRCITAYSLLPMPAGQVLTGSPLSAVSPGHRLTPGLAHIMLCGESSTAAFWSGRCGARRSAHRQQLLSAPLDRPGHAPLTAMPLHACKACVCKSGVLTDIL